MSIRDDKRNQQIFELVAVQGMTGAQACQELDLMMSPQSAIRVAVEHANRIGYACTNVSQLRRQLGTTSTYIRRTVL